MMLRVILIGFILLALVGCGKTYSYNSVEYATPREALAAVQSDARQKIAAIEPKEEPKKLSAKLVIPSFKRIQICGVRRTGSPDLEQVNYVTSVIYLGFQGMGEALVRRNLFTRVDREESFDTEFPVIGDHDLLIWLYLDERGRSQWYLLDRELKKKTAIPVDWTLSGTERLLSWLEGIEKNLDQLIGTNHQGETKAENSLVRIGSPLVAEGGT